MFFGDLRAAFRNIARAIRIGGRLTLLSWQPPPANEWVSELTGALVAGRDLPAPGPGAPEPFALADPSWVNQLLAETRFTDVEIDPLQGPMWFGVDPGDAYDFALGLLGWMLDGVSGDQRAQALSALRSTVAAHHTADGVRIRLRYLAHPGTASLRGWDEAVRPQLDRSRASAEGEAKAVVVRRRSHLVPGYHYIIRQDLAELWEQMRSESIGRRNVTFGPSG